MKTRKTILPLLVCFSLVLTSFNAMFAEETPQTLQTDQSETYLIDTADALFAFAELAKTTAERDKAAGSTRTILNAKLTADINLNPGAAFAYDRNTGLVTVTNGENSYKMGTGMNGTELGSFHPMYNELCTNDEWILKTEEEKNALVAEMNENINALGLCEWTPIGTKDMPYIGTFDGNGHKIDGLYINDENIGHIGLFGYTGLLSNITYTGNVKNLEIGENSLVVGYKIKAEGATGSIVGSQSGSDRIESCVNRALVVGKSSQYPSYNAERGSYGSWSPVAYGAVGGITGLTLGTVADCENYGTVISDNFAGGISGNLTGYKEQNDIEITDCVNYGTIYAHSFSIYDGNYSSGYAGGIVGNNGGGSFAGWKGDDGGTITNCINRGAANGYIAAGIAARMGGTGSHIKYSANFGSVSAVSVASGLVGYAGYQADLLESSFNAGMVSLIQDESLLVKAPNAKRSAKAILPLKHSNNTLISVKNCYNDSTVFPAADGELVDENIQTTNCRSVTTEFFATGEPACEMGSYRSYGWRQNIPVPEEDGKIPEIYPTTSGTRRVYKATHYCCHADEKNKNADKEYFYSNDSNDINDEHTPDQSGICSHCRRDLRKPIFLINTLPEAKVGESYYVTIELSLKTPLVLDAVTASVSDTDDTAFTFSKGLTGESRYSFSQKEYYYISGIPTEAGTLTFTLSATNENGTTKKTYTLKINEADPLEITTDSLDNATAGEGYWRRFSVNSSLPTTWEIAKGSSLPDGLTLGEDGAIDGTPTTDGKYTFTVIATAGNQTVSKTFTLVVLEEGGCKHRDMVPVPGVRATCLHDGIEEYYHCSTCELDFFDKDGTNEMYSESELKTASNHTDENNDGKCDFCEKNMPIFKKVTNESDIVCGGTYIFVTEIDNKYYALTIPPENEYGREYTDFMNLCEITPDSNNAFSFSELEASDVIMLKTEFASESSEPLLGSPRYNLNSVFDSKRYSLCSDDYSPFFQMYPNDPINYSYRIALDNSGAALIGSVHQSWWDAPETADNGLLRAFDMTYGSENKKFMSFFDESEYNGANAKYSGAEMTRYPIYLYRMTDFGQTNGSVAYTVSDMNDNVDLTAFSELFGNYEGALLSNVSGIANAVNQTAVTALIDKVKPQQANVTAKIYADITATDAKTETDEKGNKIAASVTYSVTPRIIISSENGDILSQTAISDSDLNGAPIMVTLHTGGIYPEQIIHYKKDGTKEYFYSQYSKEVQEGAKTFKSGNGFVTITIDSFSDIKILASAEPEGDIKNSLSFDSKMLTATVDNAGSYTFIFAGYEKDGKLSYLKTFVQDLITGANTVKIPEEVDISAVNKIMLWKDLTSLQPVCGAWEKDLK